MIIYPSVLETSKETFNSQMIKLSSLFDFFQIDIADGLFVPNKTIPIDDMTILFTNSHLNSKKYEFHLMVQNYTAEIEKLTELQGAISIERVLVHFTPLEHTNYSRPPAPFEYGIVINPEDMIEGNFVILRNFPYIQIMTVNPGFQGKPFLEEELKKIELLRKLGYTGKILLDGGINDQTLEIISKQKYKPDIVCPGSYLKDDPEKNLKKLQKIVSHS
jgi:pentose-5-phosphate-3-epimerase